MSFWDSAWNAISDAYESVLDFFRDDEEPARPKAKRDNGFVEPSTSTHPDERVRIRFDGHSPLPKVGVYKAMGYRVGKSGRLPRDRREILWRTFRGYLTAAGGDSADVDEYLYAWGPCCSAVRLDTMISTLTGLILNAERRTSTDMSEAIRDWEEDRRWLEGMRREWLTYSHPH